MAKGNFNKYRVKPNTDKPQVLVDPILNFFNGGFLMPAKQGGMLAYPYNNNQSGYVAPRMDVGGFNTTTQTTTPPWLKGLGAAMSVQGGLNPIMSGVGNIINYFSGSNKPSTQQSTQQSAQTTPTEQKSMYRQMYDLYSNSLDKFHKEHPFIDKVPYSGKTIRLTKGRLTGADIDTGLLDHIKKIAAANKMDPYRLAALISRESTFGVGTGKDRAGSSRNLVSGWNVDEDYIPYDLDRFLADRRVPGIGSFRETRGWSFWVDDRDKVAKYLSAHPQLLQQYQKKLNSIKKLDRNINYFDLASQWINRPGGVRRYNPGARDYETLYNQDLNLLHQDPAFSKYFGTKENGGPVGIYGYRNYNQNILSNKAMGGMTSCPKGQVWDEGRQKCVTILPPIYTDDPRKIQNYNDSLNLYKTSTAAHKQISSGLNLKNVINADLKYFHDPEFRNAYTRLEKFNHRSSTGKLYNLPIHLITQLEALTPPNDMLGYSVFGQPVQPYILKQKPILKLQQEPILKRKNIKQKPIEISRTFNPKVTSLDMTTLPLPKINMGKYKVDYFDPTEEGGVQGGWQTRSFKEEKEAADYMNQRMNENKFYGPSMTQRVEYKSGGDISIPDLNADKWLMKYEVGGPGDGKFVPPVYTRDPRDYQRWADSVKNFNESMAHLASSRKNVKKNIDDYSVFSKEGVASAIGNLFDRDVRQIRPKYAEQDIPRTAWYDNTSEKEQPIKAILIGDPKFNGSYVFPVGARTNMYDKQKFFQNDWANSHTYSDLYNDVVPIYPKPVRQNLQLINPPTGGNNKLKKVIVPTPQPSLKKKVIDYKRIPYNRPQQVGVTSSGISPISIPPIQKGPTRVGWNVEYFDPNIKGITSRYFNTNEEAEKFYNDPANDVRAKYSDVSSYEKRAYGGSILKFEDGGWLEDYAEYANGGQLCPPGFVKDARGNCVVQGLVKAPSTSESTSIGINKPNINALEQAAINRAREAQGSIRPAQPPRSAASKAWAIATHPMTALSYKVKGQDIPDYFERGEKNPYDMAIDIVNPLSYINQAKQVKEDIGQGNYISAGIGALGLIPGEGAFERGAGKFLHNKKGISLDDFESAINYHLGEGLGIKKNPVNLKVKVRSGNKYPGLDVPETEPKFTIDLYNDGRHSGYIGLDKLNTADYNIPGKKGTIYTKVSDYPYAFSNFGEKDLKGSGISGEFNKAITNALQEYELGKLYSSRVHTNEGLARWKNLVKKGKASEVAPNRFELYKKGGSVNGWLDRYDDGGFITTETTTLNPQAATLQRLLSDFNFVNEMKNRPMPSELDPNRNINFDANNPPPMDRELEKGMNKNKPLVPIWNFNVNNTSKSNSFSNFLESNKYAAGGFATTETTTINPSWSMATSVPEWGAKTTPVVQKPAVTKKVVETPKKLPAKKSYPGRPATLEEWQAYNTPSSQTVTTGSYRLPTDAEWEAYQKKKGVPTVNINKKIPAGWHVGDQDVVQNTSTPQLTESQKFQFKNPYITPNPDLNDTDPRLPEYWWSEKGWNPEKQMTTEGMTAFARLYPNFANPDADREWVNIDDERSAWKKRVYPWQIPGSPQYKAYAEISQLEKEKNELLGKTAVQLLDPSGISMWGDTWQSYKDLYNKPGLWNATIAGVNTVASLPLVKYFGEEVAVPVKGGEAAAKVAEITTKLDKLYSKYPEISRFQKMMNFGKKGMRYLSNSDIGKLVHYVGGEPFMKYFDKATGAEKLFKLPTTGFIPSVNKMERFGKASIELPINLYVNNANIKDIKNEVGQSTNQFYNFKRADGSVFQINKEVQDKQLAGSIPWEAQDPNWDKKGTVIPLLDNETLNSLGIYIPAMYNSKQKSQTKIKKLPNKK